MPKDNISKFKMGDAVIPTPHWVGRNSDFTESWDRAVHTGVVTGKIGKNSVEVEITCPEWIKHQWGRNYSDFLSDSDRKGKRFWTFHENDLMPISLCDIKDCM